MTYFCFIESDILSIPHMEPLIAEELESAKAEAEALLHQHASGYAAHVFENDDKVVTIRKTPPDARPGPVSRATVPPMPDT